MARTTTRTVTTTRITLRERVAQTKPTLEQLDDARQALTEAQLDLDTCPWNDKPAAFKTLTAAAAHQRALEALRYRMSTGYAA